MPPAKFSRKPHPPEVFMPMKSVRVRLLDGAERAKNSGGTSYHDDITRTVHSTSHTITGSSRLQPAVVQYIIRTKVELELLPVLPFFFFYFLPLSPLIFSSFWWSRNNDVFDGASGRNNLKKRDRG